MAFGWLKKAVKSATGGVASLGKQLGKVPIVGGGLKGAFTLTIGAPFSVAHAVASGQRIDKVALGHLKSQLGAINEVAPYAQTIVQVVPGVGQGVSGAIAGALALANGKNITTALKDAVKSSLPGGPAAKAAFDLAEAAVQGKPLDAIALAALPIPDAQKKLVAQGLATAKDLAHGKRLDAALLNTALAALPADVKKAVTVGMAVAHGQVLQAAKNAGQMPAIHPFKGAPVIALGKGNSVTATEAVRRTVAAAKGSDPVAKKEAQALIRNTVVMARTGTPAQRVLAGNAVKVLVGTANAQKTGKPLPGPAVRKQWQVTSKGRIHRTA
jgi:hypothetical protein